VPGDDVDLVDLHLTFELHGRDFGSQAGAELLGHELHVGLVQRQFLGDLPVREVQAHQVQAQNPDPQRLVVPRQYGAGQVVEAAAAGRATIALPVRLRIVPAVASRRSSVATRAADAVRPAMLTDQFVALGVVDQRREVHQARHGQHRGWQQGISSTGQAARRHPPPDHPETQ
jgi:hypothetical protein